VGGVGEVWVSGCWLIFEILGEKLSLASRDRDRILKFEDKGIEREEMKSTFEDERIGSASERC